MIIFDLNGYGVNLAVVGITYFSFIGFCQCINIFLSNIRLIILQSVKDYVSIQIIWLCLVRIFGPVRVKLNLLSSRRAAPVRDL